MRADRCIFFQFAKAHQLANRFVGLRLAGLGLTPIQSMVMTSLEEQDQITSIALGRRVELDSATLTGILDRLEARGLIERRRHPHDRRSVRVHLTSEGREIGKKAVTLMTSGNVEFVKDLTCREYNQLFAIIKKLRRGAANPIPERSEGARVSSEVVQSTGRTRSTKVSIRKETRR